MKVLQAMALGKAVVTTPLGAEGLAVAPQAHPLAIAVDSDGLASATTDLLVDDDQRRALGEQARAFVAEHHSWSAYAQRVEAMYSAVIEGSHKQGRSLRGLSRA
jgi:polysaccharide biosynthesis protein PslH